MSDYNFKSLALRATRETFDMLRGEAQEIKDDLMRKVRNIEPSLNRAAPDYNRTLYVFITRELMAYKAKGKITWYGLRSGTDTHPYVVTIVHGRRFMFKLSGSGIRGYPLVEA